MDGDKEPERGMLSISPSKQHVQSSAALTVERPVPVPRELMCLLPEGAARPSTEATVTVPEKKRWEVEKGK
ncbi:hypothetical protein VZT92_008293 [Zoarces viviparus]|uniref:Uncharacterized protein n=1 Tax=Zoarces viviparus TaxID=48416 RepID=A0AAW1FF98_ZOAVI